MNRYRKKPVVVEAIQVDEGNAMDVARWVGVQHEMIVAGPPIPIVTLEGTMMANAGDWVVKGVAGEFYPVKPDIFEQTYEAVE